MNLIVMAILCLSFAEIVDEGNSVMKWRIIATGNNTSLLLYYSLQCDRPHPSTFTLPLKPALLLHVSP